MGNLCYKIYWLASRWKANKKKIKCYCTVFVCFTLYLREVSENKPSGAYTWRGDLAGFFFLSHKFYGIFHTVFFSSWLSCLSIGQLFGRSHVQNPGQTITQSLKITE